MINEERVRDLAKTLLNMKMVTSEMQALERARAIIGSAPNEGPPISTMAPAEDNMAWNQVPSQIDRAREMLTDIKQQDTPAPITLKEAATQAQTIIKDADDFDKTAAQLDELKQAETAEKLDSDELVQHIKALTKELQDSRKDIAALRAKMVDIETAVAKATDLANRVAPISHAQAPVPHAQPMQQQRSYDGPAMPPPMSALRQAPPSQSPQPQQAEQKPRGQNPMVDLTKIFGRK
jgi:chromosome segregation ATPase